MPISFSRTKTVKLKAFSDTGVTETSTTSSFEFKPTVKWVSIIAPVFGAFGAAYGFGIYNGTIHAQTFLV